MSPRLLSCAFAALIVVTGCSTRQAKLDRPPVAHALAGMKPESAMIPETAETTETPAPAPADEGTAKALAQKATSYTKDLEQVLTKRVEPPPKPAQASEVEWLDVSGLYLSPAPYRGEPLAAAEPDEAVAQAVIDVPAQPEMAAAIVSAAPARQSASSAGVTLPPTTVAEVAANLSPDALGQQLKKRISDDPRDLSGHLDYQLMQFIQNRPAPDLMALASLPTEDREVLTAVIDGLSNFRSGVRADQNMLLSRKVKPLVDMGERLRSQADLNIPRALLCTRVVNFGVYDAIEPVRFSQGTAQWVVVYCEVENFSSQLNDGGLWQTELTAELALFMENGMLVWQDKPQQVNDVCRNRRRDFFVGRKVQLPVDQLSIGRYLLKVTVIDKQSSRVAESTVPVQVVAQAVQ